MNSIKDLLASVKCCISSDVYMKDLSIRYGNISTGIMYDAIINRILYSVLSNTEYYNSENIEGYYTDIIISGSTLELLNIIITETNIIGDVINNENKTIEYVRINDTVIEFENNGNTYTAIFENDILTITNINNNILITITAKKIDQCFDHDDICRIYEYLNKKCKTC